MNGHVSWGSWDSCNIKRTEIPCNTSAHLLRQPSHLLLCYCRVSGPRRLTNGCIPTFPCSLASHSIWPMGCSTEGQRTGGSEWCFLVALPYGARKSPTSSYQACSCYIALTTRLFSLCSRNCSLISFFPGQLEEIPPFSTAASCMLCLISYLFLYLSLSLY